MAGISLKQSTSDKVDGVKDPKATETKEAGFYERNKKLVLAGIVIASLSVLTAGAATIIASVAPALFASIVSFPIFNLTVAGIVGESAALQVGFMSAVVLAASTALAGLSQGVYSLINFVSELSKKVPSTQNGGNSAGKEEPKNTSINSLAPLHKSEPGTKPVVESNVSLPAGSQVRDSKLTGNKAAFHQVGKESQAETPETPAVSAGAR